MQAYPARSSEDVKALVSAVSSDRFSSYLDASDQDAARALRLYEWNADLCAAFYVPLQSVEVGFRNALHRELQKQFGQDWPFSQSFLRIDDEISSTLQQTIHLLRRGAQLADTPHVVASLHFGFWTKMLNKHLTDSLWIPAVHKAFPEYRNANGKNIDMKIASATFREIRKFRNRVFHHEPIFKRTSLSGDYQRLLDAAAWMYPKLADWICERSMHCKMLIDQGPPS